MQRFFEPFVAGALAALCASSSQAVNFKSDTVSGSFDSSLSLGLGVRAKAPDSRLILSGNTGGPAGTATPVASGLGDQGTLNYAQGDLFTAYLKGSHELLLQLPQDVRFMARANWVRDVAATRTTGWTSSAFTVQPMAGGLADDARQQLRFKGRMLDLWLSKTFSVGEEQARVRVGNQVVNWGESLFTAGGINATNAVDVMRLLQPGTQLKEAILPAPMLSVATGLGQGLNAEVYLQSRWRRSELPPSGSYWSVVNGLGAGHDAYGVADTSARQGGQWGASLHYKPPGTSLDLGLYAMNYHDKTPQLHLDPSTFAPSLIYPEDRRLLGMSANFPVGDWAVGTELSYRPKDAVFLNSNTSGCASQNGNCWVDKSRLQWHLTGLLNLSPGNARSLLDATGASNGLLLSEFVLIHYPGLRTSQGGDLVAAGGWGWGNEEGATFDPAVAAANSHPEGSKTSSGINLDFSLTYDGSLLPGWQVTPELFFSWALQGRTPNAQGTWMKGAKSANFSVSFAKNPASWQFGINYAKFWGGSSVFDQVLRDRDFVGAYGSFSF